MKLAPQYIVESQDQFLALFPHRFDYIWAEHSTGGQSPEWRTERRHPLSDRLICQGSYLYGVRFGAETQYCLLDIDTSSPYHPERDPFAISRIVAALEPLGLISYVVTTSSYSGGVHLYFPFAQPQSSWRLAIGLTCLLENAGFKPTPGQLEVFPNPRPYLETATPSLFNAHRLPLQAGSYLLNQALQPIWSDRGSFIQQWQFAQERNDLDKLKLKHLVKQAKRQHFQVSGKADKFINDLNAEIELGWTGYGQTNRLLGRITMRTYIFHHLLIGSEPLTGQALVQAVVEIAQSLPGYRDYCRHQHEIEHRAAEWAHCIENSHYFPYGSAKGKFKPKQPELEAAIEKVPSWNQQQSESTRDRIRGAIADLLNKEALPAKTTARFHSLLNYGIGGSSLYRHRDLWHPDCLSEEHLPEKFDDEFDAKLEVCSLVNYSLNCSVEEPRFCRNSCVDNYRDLAEDHTDLSENEVDRWLQSSPSLLHDTGGNAASNQGSVVLGSQSQNASGSNSSGQAASHTSDLNSDSNSNLVNQSNQSKKMFKKMFDRSQMVDIAVLETWQPFIAPTELQQICRKKSEFSWSTRMQHLLALTAPAWVAKALVEFAVT